MNTPKIVDSNDNARQDGALQQTTTPPAAPVADASSAGQSLSGRRVVVVGYGALGPLIAHQLLGLGCEVIVVDDEAFNTALVAAGWILVYHPRDKRGPNWGVHAEALWAHDGEALYRHGTVTWERTVLERTSNADHFPRELSALRDFKKLTSNAPGVTETVELTTAVAPAAIWRPQLTAILERNPRFSRVVQHVPDAVTMSKLAEIYDADFVVNATGVSQAYMNADQKFSLDYGIVAYLKRPRDWTHGVRSRDTGPELGWSHRSISQRYGFRLPGGTTDPYYVTQTALDRILVGGCMWPMTPEEANALRASGYQVDPHILAYIVARAEEAFPELRGLDFTEDFGACSIRPSRDKYLLEWDHEYPAVLHVGGAGGAGITLAPLFAHHVAAAIERRLHSTTGC